MAEETEVERLTRKVDKLESQLADAREALAEAEQRESAEPQIILTPIPATMIAEGVEF